GHDHDRKTNRERPSQPVTLAAPIALRAYPEAGEQILLAELLRLFRSEVRLGVDDFPRRRVDMIAGLGHKVDDGRLFRCSPIGGHSLGHVPITPAISEGSRVGSVKRTMVTERFDVIRPPRA